MTQEILDYSLIKSQFLTLSAEDIISMLKTEDNLTVYCLVICNIIDEEDFFYTSPELIEKLADLIHAKRFETKHSKETVDYLNRMLTVVNNYKKMSISEKKSRTNYWLKQSSYDREIPCRKFPGCTKEAMYTIMSWEYYYAKMLLEKQEETIINNNPVHILSTINLLANCYPTVFKENPDALSLCYSFSITLQDKIFPKGYHTYSKMAKKTERLLEKVEREQEVETNKKYIIKKD